MRVLFFIPNLSHGGAEKVLVNLVNNMDKERFDITVMTLFDVGVNKQYLSKDIKYRYVFKYMPRGNIHILKLFTPKQLYRHCIKEHYDIVVSYLEGPTARIVSGCTDSRVKLVEWIHVEQQNKKMACRAFRNYKEAETCYLRYDRTICVSNAVMRDFKMLFRSVKNVSVLYNTVESDFIREQAKEQIEEKSFTDYTGIKICMVGKVSKRKGVMRVAHIHKRLTECGYNHRIYILGTGDEREKIEKYICENNLTDSFIFLGYNTNPYKYISASDILVCASLSEGFSTAVTEALIVGTPVVTTNCAGMTELLGKNNEYGIVTENNEKSLEEGIKRILDSRSTLKEYKEKSAERGKLFETHKTVRAVEKMLKDLMEEKV